MLNRNLTSPIILLTITVCSGLIFCCGPQTKQLQDPVACQAVFQPDKLDLDAAKNFSMSDLIAVEKCGFNYHPSTSFYGEIIDSKEYPIPTLIKELREPSNDDYWCAHVMHLIKEVIEHDRFQSEVMRDHELIQAEVEGAFAKTAKDSGAYDEIHGLRDGINMYFLNHCSAE